MNSTMARVTFAHSSYAIYSIDGKLFKNVENNISRPLMIIPVGGALAHWDPTRRRLARSAESIRRRSAFALLHQGWPADDCRSGPQREQEMHTYGESRRPTDRVGEFKPFVTFQSYENLHELRNEEMSLRQSYHDRVRKIRKAAAIALKELDQLRSGGPMTQEALDAEVARIAREKLQPYGCDLVVHRMGDGVTRFLIKVQSTGRGYDLNQKFFPS